MAADPFYPNPQTNPSVRRPPPQAAPKPNLYGNRLGTPNTTPLYPLGYPRPPAPGNAGQAQQTASQTEQAPTRSLGDYAGDLAVGLLKGAVSLPESVVGIADLATGGQVGKYLHDTLHYRPAETQQILDSWYSPAQQYANHQVAKAEGFHDTMAALADNPSVIAKNLTESVFPALAGGVAAKGIGLLGKAAQLSRPLTSLETSSLSSGLLGAGGNAEAIRNQTHDQLLTPEQSLYAGLSGLASAALNHASGSAAQRLGHNDLDTWLAGGGRFSGRPLQALPQKVLGTANQGTQSAASAGLEQWLQNKALHRPGTQDLGKAVATGLVGGAVQGGLPPTARRPPTPHFGGYNSLRLADGRQIQTKDIYHGLLADNGGNLAEALAGTHQAIHGVLAGQAQKAGLHALPYLHNHDILDLGDGTLTTPGNVFAEAYRNTQNAALAHWLTDTFVKLHQGNGARVPGAKQNVLAGLEIGGGEAASIPKFEDIPHADLLAMHTQNSKDWAKSLTDRQLPGDKYDLKSPLLTLDKNNRGAKHWLSHRDYVHEKAKPDSKLTIRNGGYYLDGDKISEYTYNYAKPYLKHLAKFAVGNPDNLKVVANGWMVGDPKQRVHTDFNQQARAADKADANKKTAIYGHVQKKLQLPRNIRTGKPFPNANMQDAHAEIGLMTQKQDEGGTQGGHMMMTVNGQSVCNYCKHDIPAMAKEMGLNSLIIHDMYNGKIFYWRKGMSGVGIRS